MRRVVLSDQRLRLGADGSGDRTDVSTRVKVTAAPGKVI